MNSDKFIEVAVETWTDLLKCNECMQVYTYRGQSKHDWPLSSSLERACQEHDVGFWTEHEKLLLEEIRRRAPFYLAHVPPADEPLEWASLLQHHGAPTRLLDVTDSFFVALFFAIAGTRGKAAVWAFDASRLQGPSSDLNHNLSVILDLHSDSDFAPTRKLVNEAYGKDGSLGVVQVRPYFLHPRLRIQQGSFLFQFRADSYFERNLGETMGIRCTDRQRLPTPRLVDMKELPSRTAFVSRKRARVLRIVVGPSLFSDAHVELRKFNISYETLFPGLDGLARSLYYPFQVAGRKPHVSSGCRKRRP